MSKLVTRFFNQDACLLAQKLIGKVIRRKHNNHWLAARIIETEAYYLQEKGSHASLGYTNKRRALFMPAGTIYMYYARGHDSFNISCRGKGNAVLIKSALAISDALTDTNALSIMQRLNPSVAGKNRSLDNLCRGQTLLCKALDLKVTDWDQQEFDRNHFYLDDTGYRPPKIIQTTRLGIPSGRDEHLPYRFIDNTFVDNCTNNPLTKRGWREGKQFRFIQAD